MACRLYFQTQVSDDRPLVLTAGTDYFNNGHRIQEGVLMPVFKFTDAVRVGSKAAKRPSCSYGLAAASCQLPATGVPRLRDEL